ncbi:MFS transporter, partial [Streptomyces sp. NPDC003233]
MTKPEGLPPLTGPNATPEPSAGTEPAAAGLSGIALVVVLTGYALSIVDASIVNVALTSISDDLHGGAAALELVVSGYGVTYALGLVLGGRLGDAFGRRRLYAYGLAAFTVTSALCGLAPTIEFLVAARLLQGAAAAMLVPQVLATIQAATEGQARARAIGMYGATAALGMVTGQILGGLLVSLDVAGIGWRSVFAINVPIGVAALLAVRRVPATRADTKPGRRPRRVGRSRLQRTTGNRLDGESLTLAAELTS